MSHHFVLGANYPWVSCGHDFGPRPRAWAGAGATDWVTVQRELETLRELGLSVARFWVLAGGVNLPAGQDPHAFADLVRFDAPYPSGLGRAREFQPRAELPVLPRAFLTDFERLLEVCAASGIALLPSLLSFELFLPALEQPGGPMSGGRGAFVLGDRAARFLDATLEPLLEVSERHRDAIFAWELVNEPDWAAMPSGGRGPFAPPLALADLLLEGARRIARRGFVATIGFANARPSWLPPSARTSLRRLAERGAYLHQRHFYPREDLGMRLPRASESAILPCLLGELPTARAARWADPELWTTESDPDRYLAARLSLARERGYSGALLWSVRAEDAQTRWDDRVRAQVRAYSRSLPRSRSSCSSPSEGGGSSV